MAVAPWTWLPRESVEWNWSTADKPALLQIMCWWTKNTQNNSFQELKSCSASLLKIMHKRQLVFQELSTIFTLADLWDLSRKANQVLFTEEITIRKTNSLNQLFYLTPKKLQKCFRRKFLDLSFLSSPTKQKKKSSTMSIQETNHSLSTTSEPTAISEKKLLNAPAVEVSVSTTVCSMLLTKTYLSGEWECQDTQHLMEK